MACRAHETSFVSIHSWQFNFKLDVTEVKCVDRLKECLCAGGRESKGCFKVYITGKEDTLSLRCKSDYHCVNRGNVSSYFQ